MKQRYNLQLQEYNYCYTHLHLLYYYHHMFQVLKQPHHHKLMSQYSLFLVYMMHIFVHLHFLMLTYQHTGMCYHTTLV
jgi:hypothetical protein